MAGVRFPAWESFFFYSRKCLQCTLLLVADVNIIVILCTNIYFLGFKFSHDGGCSKAVFHFLFPQKAPASAPVIVWLQGGPGGSSLFGLFNENGPLVVDSSGQVSLRKVTWNTDYHMLYIDNPVSGIDR